MREISAAKIKRVNFIEYNAKVNTLGSLNPMSPKYGTTVLSSLLRDKGYDVTVYLEGISIMDFDKMTDCDLICYPVFAPALNKVRESAQRVLKEKPNIPIIMGGPQVCYFPETVIDCCDFAVRCEGDEVLPEVIACINNGGNPYAINGISYVKDGEIIHNPDPKPPAVPPTVPDLQLIEGFDRVSKGFINKRRIINTLQTSRGCRFRCKFCPTHKLFQGVYRSRDIESVIQDIKQRKKINRVFFVVDNDFCSDKKKTRELLRRIIEEDLGLRFTIFERHEIGRDEEMLDLLRRAGVGMVIVGVESLLDESLDVYNKKQTREELIKSINNIRKHGMHVLTTFVLGCDEDTIERAQEIIEFVNTNKFSLNLFIMMDLEEDESKGLMIPLNRRFWSYWRRNYPDNMSFFDYATGSFVMYFPKKMKPSTLQKAILDIYDKTFTHKNILRNVFSKNIARSIIGVNLGYGIKKMNNNLRYVIEKYKYMEFLESVEADLYDENEVLIEGKLDSFNSKKFPLLPPMEEEAVKDPYAFIRTIALIPGLLRFVFLLFRNRLSGKKGW
jgi:pyruvate-formate lyase-activating enzyme